MVKNVLLILLIYKKIYSHALIQRKAPKITKVRHVIIVSLSFLLTKNQQ